MTALAACGSSEQIKKAAPTVLLIDDDANTLIALGAILERHRIRVHDTEEESGAIQWCHSTEESIDVFVADVILQNTNGPHVVRKLKVLQPSARVLFISGFDLKELSRRGLLSEADLTTGSVEFLQKPFASEAFLEAVEKLISARPSTKTYTCARQVDV